MKKKKNTEKIKCLISKPILEKDKIELFKFNSKTKIMTYISKNK